MSVEHVTVGAEDADQRLDRWLRRRHPQLTQGRIEKMCRKGEVRVDGGRVKPATRLEPGQSVRIPPVPAAPAPEAPRPAAVSSQDAEMIRACVLWRDDHLMVLNKPPGLAVQGGSGQTRWPRRCASGRRRRRALSTGSTATPRGFCSWRARGGWRRR